MCFFKQKTAYEMRISDWSSDVCSSDRRAGACRGGKADALARNGGHDRGVMQDGTAHFMEIVEEMAVDPIGPRAQGHATNGGAGPVIWIARSEERREGQECVSTCRFRGSAYTKQTRNTTHQDTKNEETLQTHYI